MTQTAITDIYSIPGKHTVREAAGLLGVSTTRIIQLIYSGELTAQRTAGDAYLIDAKNLQTYKRIRAGNGRPWKPETAWAALWLLSGLEVNWLTYPQMRRLKLRLREMTAVELVWLTRKRATAVDVRVSPSFIDGLKESLALTGSSSSLLSEIGLTVSSHSIEGYTSGEHYEWLQSQYHFVADDNGNATIHVVDNCPVDLITIEQMPEAVVLVDLSASADTRERSTAITKLEELLHEQS